jgi:hypothetical protein
MLGWQIYIGTQKSRNQSLADHSAIAKWTTGLGGDRWLSELVQTGRAEKLKESCGYPDFYVSKAKYIVPLISKDLPQYDGFFVVGTDYVLNSKGNWDITIDQAKLSALSPEQTLYIEAWDES